MVWQDPRMVETVVSRRTAAFVSCSACFFQSVWGEWPCGASAVSSRWSIVIGVRVSSRQGTLFKTGWTRFHVCFGYKLLFYLDFTHRIS